jgi:hypothetical protein
MIASVGTSLDSFKINELKHSRRTNRFRKRKLQLVQTVFERNEITIICETVH